jgi:3-hydroxybutyryl-CoA dehydrogenase
MIPLVEVIRTEWTGDAAMDRVMALLAHAGKIPVRVEKDVPGFIGNRMQHALWREAISLVERGICDAEAVDTVVKSCFGRRLSVLGPLENADLVGTDLTLDIHNTVLADLEDRHDPSPYLERLVAGGRLGMKSGAGFHHWTPEKAAKVRDRVTTHLKKLDTILDD